MVCMMVIFVDIDMSGHLNIFSKVFMAAESSASLQRIT